DGNQERAPGFAFVATPVSNIAPAFDGWLQVQYYGAAYRFQTKFSSADSNVTTVNGEHGAGDPLLGRYHFVDSSSVVCGGTTGWYHSYALGSTTTWQPLHVNEADMLDFSAAVGSPTYTQYNDSTWDVSLALPCGDTTYFYSAFNFAVVIKRDTLNLKFVTAPGDTLPEPDVEITARAVVRGASGTGKVRFEIENHDYPGGVPDTLIWFLAGADTVVTPQEVSMNVDTAEVTLISTTYWGAVDVTARYIDANLDTLYEQTKRWPTDTDNDGIADGWEMDSLNGGSLSLPDTNGTPVANDVDWDWEMTTQFTNHHHGDGITKLSEYQGVMIGSSHCRLRPNVKEVFIDTLEAEYAAWAAQELETQLFLKTYLVAGAIGAGGVQTLPGSQPLMWLGENRATFSSYRNYIKIKDDGHKVKFPRQDTDSLANGLIVLGGRYWTGLRVTDPTCVANPACSPKIKSGVYYGRTTNPLYKNRGKVAALSQVFYTTIDNLLDASVNSIPESATHYFYYPIADGRDTSWTSIYNGTDIDGGGFGLVNPLDLLSPTTANDSLDGLSGGQNTSDIIRINTLHELAHAIGVGPNDTHPKSSSGPSPMQRGHGPYTVSTFSLLDKSQFRLK
ncbi:MAG: hypothetical protein WBW88_11700, partial [Rhodothermales bacterium]